MSFESKGISRRKIIKLSLGALILLAMDRGVSSLENLIPVNTFYSKATFLKNEIDRQPNNKALQDAFATFVSAHIGILGAAFKNQFAAESLSHYFYGEGISLDISDPYKKAVEEKYDSIERYLSELLSISFNLRSNIQENVPLEKSILERVTKPVPKPSEFNGVVAMIAGDMSLAMGRHTLKADWRILSDIVIKPSTVEYINNIIRHLFNNRKTFSVHKIMITAPELSLYDNYHFSNDPDAIGGYGYVMQVKELQIILKVIENYLGKINLQKYMGRSNYQLLMNGTIDIPQKGLVHLERLRLAKPFDMRGKLSISQPFEVEIIAKKS